MTLLKRTQRPQSGTAHVPGVGSYVTVAGARHFDGLVKILTRTFGKMEHKGCAPVFRHDTTSAFLSRVSGALSSFVRTASRQNQ